MEWRIASPFSVVYSLYWSHLILNLVIKLHLYRQSFGPLNSSETAYIPKAEITSFESDLSLPALPSVNRSLWNYAHLSASTLFHHEHNWFWPLIWSINIISPQMLLTCWTITHFLLWDVMHLQDFTFTFILFSKDLSLFISHYHPKCSPPCSQLTLPSKSGQFPH